MRVGVEQGFRRGHQGEGLGLVGRALVGRVEAADRVDLVAEEVEPQRQLLARGEDVDQRAAYRIFAMLGDSVGALVAERGHLPDQRLALDPLAGGDAAGQLADAERGQQALGRGIGGRDQQLRLVALAPAARSASPGARPSRARRAKRGRRAGSPRPGRSAPRLRARTAARCRRARASPLRRPRSRPRGRLARADAPRARGRRRATAGSPTARRRGSAARFGARSDALQRLAHFAAIRHVSRASLAERLRSIRAATNALRGGLARLPMRPGHDVDVLLARASHRTARVHARPTPRGERRRTRRSACRLRACRDDARARRGASVPDRKA